MFVLSSAYPGARDVWIPSSPKSAANLSFATFNERDIPARCAEYLLCIFFSAGSVGQARAKVNVRHLSGKVGVRRHVEGEVRGSSILHVRRLWVR